MRVSTLATLLSVSAGNVLAQELATGVSYPEIACPEEQRLIDIA